MQIDAITVVFYAALIGAGAALLGGIVAGIFSLLTIRMNHKADLKKIAYEKQIEALRELYEGVCNLSDYSKEMVNLADKVHDIDEVLPIYQVWSEEYDKLTATYRKNAVFIPDIINDLYHERDMHKIQDASKLRKETLVKEITCHDELMLQEIKNIFISNNRCSIFYLYPELSF
jgi:hypothetical protein